MILGIHLTLLIGPTVAIPAPPPVTEALVGVEVTHSDEGKSGFQLTFQVGRSGPLDLVDYSLLTNPLLRPFNRVILMVLFNATPRVLMDGFITQQQLTPSNEPGAATLTITGEDVSVMMDLEEKTEEHPGQAEPVIAMMVLTKYMQFLAMPPLIIPPTSVDVPLPTDRIPAQRGTDLNFLNALAERFGFVFYIMPGPAPFQNTAYWGPRIRPEPPQSALTVNAGPATNVDSINFQYNALAQEAVNDVVQDSLTNAPLPVIVPTSTRIGQASQPAIVANQGHVRTRRLPQNSGLTIAQAYSRAIGVADQSADRVLIANGELNSLQYGDLLRARGLVGVRGVGYQHDGFFYVKSVTHSIKKGEYKQKFTLTREGLGSLTPAVIP